VIIRLKSWKRKFKDVMEEYIDIIEWMNEWDQKNEPKKNMKVI
jgi:hypothetical protein